MLEDPEIAEPNEIQRVIDAIDTKKPFGMRDACIVLMLYDLGLRCGELCNLTMDDVHLEGRVGWIYVRAATTKSRKARPVPLGAQLLEMLTIYIDRYRDAHSIRKRVPSDYLFRNRYGNKLSPGGVLQMLYKRCDQAGVRRIHPHLLRHSNACLEIEAGAPELFVKQKLANETGLAISVCHLPPGTSKWNKIEHRLFAFISQNWRGKPLVSYEVIVNLIAATTTKTGLSVRCQLDTNSYPAGLKVSDQEMAEIRLQPDDFHGEWNYTILPVSRSK